MFHLRGRCRGEMCGEEMAGEGTTRAPPYQQPAGTQALSRLFCIKNLIESSQQPWEAATKNGKNMHLEAKR